MAKSFTHEALPGRVVFGPGSLRWLPREIERLGSERVMVIVGGRTKVAKEISLSLADRYAGAFTGVKPQVPFGVVGAAKETARRLHADCLLAIGGGSAVGTAKAVALEVPLPIVAVPTTYAGSEMTPIYGVTDALGKRTGRNVSVLPKVIVYDPRLTLSLPPSVTGPSAMNAMVHCVEALWAPGSNPITSLIAEEGIRALARHARGRARPRGPRRSQRHPLRGVSGGAAFAVAGSGIHHKICHVLGGAYDLPHAETHTVVLPHAVAFGEPAIPEIMDRVARALDRVSDTGGDRDGPLRTRGGDWSAYGPERPRHETGGPRRGGGFGPGGGAEVQPPTGGRGRHPCHPRGRLRGPKARLPVGEPGLRLVEKSSTE